MLRLIWMRRRCHGRQRQPKKAEVMHPDNQATLTRVVDACHSRHSSLLVPSDAAYAVTQ